MAVVALSVAYFLNELGAEYGLLSQTHYIMVLDCLTKRDRHRRAAKSGVPLAQLPPETREDVDRVADSATQVMVAQSTVAAVLEFLVAQVAGQLSDAMGRRPILIASAIIMSACKAAPALLPSMASVWLAKAGGEAANTIITSTLLSAVSDMFASDVKAYGSVAGRLRALGGISWAIGPTLGMRLNDRAGPRLSYLCATAAALALSAACAFGLPETSCRTAGARVAFGELRLSSFVPLGFMSMFSRKGVYAQCGAAVPKLAVSLALMRLAFFGVYDVQDSHVRRVLGWTSTRLSRYRTIEGMTDFSQGALAEYCLSYLGNLWGSVIGPLSNGIAFFIQGFAAPTVRRRYLMYGPLTFIRYLAASSVLQSCTLTWPNAHLGCCGRHQVGRRGAALYTTGSCSGGVVGQCRQRSRDWGGKAAIGSL